MRQGALAADEIFDALRESLTVIGITGGTGCGKTTALNVLRAKGAMILDCDEIYHALTVSSEPMRRELTARFGPVYQGDTLDRKALAAIVFSDPAALLDLNAITHRYVVDELTRRLREYAIDGGTLAAIDAIGLLEIEYGKKTAFNVAVTAPTADRCSARGSAGNTPCSASARRRTTSTSPRTVTMCLRTRARWRNLKRNVISFLRRY